MLKKIVLLLIGVCGFSVSGTAQTMKEVFLSMPDSVMPLLSKDNRADFVDFLASKMQARVKNAYDENAYMDTLTADYTYLRPTPSSSVTMKLLPLSDSIKIICLVHTYQADAADSKLLFFDTKWHPLDGARFVSNPSTDDFLQEAKAGDELTFSSVKNKLNVSMVVAHLSPANTDLTFTYDDRYLSQEDQKLVKGYIRSAITKKWENGKFISK